MRPKILIIPALIVPGVTLVGNGKTQPDTKKALGTSCRTKIQFAFIDRRDSA